MVNWTPGNKFQWNLNRNLCIFIQENAFENIVCKIAAILSLPQCVDKRSHECKVQDDIQKPPLVGKETSSTKILSLGGVTTDMISTRKIDLFVLTVHDFTQATPIWKLSFYWLHSVDQNGKHLQKMILNVYWMDIILFWFKFHRNLFLGI